MWLWPPGRRVVSVAGRQTTEECAEQLWGEKGLVGTERDILLGLYLPTPTSSGSQRPYSRTRVAQPWPSACLAPAMVTFFQCSLSGEIHAHTAQGVGTSLSSALRPFSVPSLLLMGGGAETSAEACSRGQETLATIRCWGPFLSRPRLEWATLP